MGVKRKVVMGSGKGGRSYTTKNARRGWVQRAIKREGVVVEGDRGRETKWRRKKEQHRCIVGFWATVTSLCCFPPKSGKEEEKEEGKEEGRGQRRSCSCGEEESTSCQSLGQAAGRDSSDPTHQKESVLICVSGSIVNISTVMKNRSLYREFKGPIFYKILCIHLCFYPVSDLNSFFFFKVHLLLLLLVFM